MMYDCDDDKNRRGGSPSGRPRLNRPPTGRDESAGTEKDRPQRRRSFIKGRRGPGRGHPPHPSGQPKRTYHIIINALAGRDDPESLMRQARKLERRLRRTGVGCIIQSASKWDEYIQMVTQACRQRPSALIVFGGDGSVRLAASRIIPAKGLLGIVPCGCFNNIYASLYGHTDIDRAMELIQPGRERRIDAGMANRNFFLGQLISGVVPALIERLEDKKLPRLSMTWSKLAAKAADDVEARSATIKVDAYTFKTQPLLLHVHLLPDLLTLRFAPPAQAGDGKLFLIYDRDGTRDMVAQYIRDLRKNRYYYLDGMQLIRGRRISIAPAAGRTWLIDGDPIRFTGEEITIEVLPQVLRVFSDAAPQS